MAERRTILITGCSSGIGEDAARTLSSRGWQVFATCRREEDCERLRAEGLESFRLDYQDEESIAGAFDEAMARSGGRIDALFNNGAFAQPGALEDLPTDGLRALFEANFFGWHELTRRALRVMRRQGHGRVVQCSSVLGFSALRMRGAYIASKHAIEGYTDTLRLELRGSGIHVILLEPGPIRTRIRVNAQPHYERWIDRQSPVWAEFYRTVLEPRLYASAPRPDPGERGPEETTRRLLQALEAKRPNPRYYVTVPTYGVGLMKRLLPTRLSDAIMSLG